MTKHGTILLIEDGVDDVLMYKKVFAEAGVYCPVQVIHNDADAVKYLSGEGVYGNRDSYPLPFLVLLDLALPQEGGFGVLRWLHDRPGLRKKFNVIVLSPDAPGADVQLAYELGAQSFLLKPSDHPRFLDAVRRVKEYWIDLNLRPEDNS